MATKPSKRRDEEEEEDEDEDEEEEEEKPKSKMKNDNEDKDKGGEDEEEDEDEDEEDEEEEDEKPKKKDEDEEDEEDDDDDDDEDEDEDAKDDDEDDKDGKDKEDAKDDDEDAPKSESSWKIVGEKAQKKLVEKTQAVRASGMRREVWLRDGDKKKFRFLTREPLAMIVQHSLPRKIKGKLCFPKYTCTQSDDCQFCLKGLPASISAVYEVHNFEKFTKKDGTEITVDTRFYVVPESRHQVIQKVLANCKPDSKDWLIEVERVGSGRKTTYIYLPLKKKPVTDEEKKLKSISSTFDEAYKPLPLKEQKLALSTATFDDDSADD